MRRYLVVANKTLVDEGVLREIRGCLEGEPCDVHILVPATAPHRGLTWTHAEARREAEERLRYAQAWLGTWGVSASGEVVDSNPVDAVGDVLRREAYQEIILSTLPAGVSRWLRQDLPSRLRRTFGLPVRHVTASPSWAPEAA